jgi:hypothetical protein
MPISEDVQRELSRLFGETADLGVKFIDVTALTLLGRVERWGEDCDDEQLTRQLAVCHSVLLASVDSRTGDTVLIKDADHLLIRFVLPRRWLSPAAA